FRTTTEWSGHWTALFRSRREDDAFANAVPEPVLTDSPWRRNVLAPGPVVGPDFGVCANWSGHWTRRSNVGAERLSRGNAVAAAVSAVSPGQAACRQSGPVVGPNARSANARI